MHGKRALFPSQLRRMLPWVLLGIAMAWCVAARAADDAPASEQQGFSLIPDSVWLNPGVLSFHFNRNAGYREDNWGFGAQLNYSHDLSLLGGTFINSDNRRSHDAGILWEPYAFGPIKLGAVAGAFDGYPHELNGGWFPAILPMASTSFGRVGANLTIVPNYKDKLHGAVVLQLLLKVW